MTDTDPSTADRFADIRARLAAIEATLGPCEVWESEGEASIAADGGQYVARIGKLTWPNTRLVAELIANAPTDIKVLLEEAWRLDQLRKVSEAMAVDKIAELNSRVGELEKQLAAFDGWLLAPHHDTGGEYGLYHDCIPDEAVIGISERSLSGVLADVRDHVCEAPTTAPDSVMDPFEAADDADRRWSDEH